MNDQDLLTLYAGLAMQAFISKGGSTSLTAITKLSFDIAEQMIKEQGERIERLRSTQGN
jgi:hypothetical protein